MHYTLMHKNTLVAGLFLDEVTGVIEKVDAIYDEKHLPVGVNVKNGIVDRSALNAWWLDRSIPASRSGVRKALEILNLANTKMLLTRNFGLSLSDQYWIRPQGSDVQWGDINFFENPFSEDIGDALFGNEKKRVDFDFCSPDNTSDGFLKKRWKIINGRRCLMKTGSNPFMQQPFNEVIALIVAERLDILHVTYTLVWDDDLPYSVCDDFIGPDTELISAWRVMQTVRKENDTSVYQHYLNCCERLGIANIRKSVDQMIVLDYIISNEDRHQNNFGLVRNADTLQWLGAAPLFDSGSSLGYDKLSGQILSEKGVDCKPFKKTHEEQIRLVSSFDWIEFERLRDLEDEMRAVFAKAGDYIEDARKDAIVTSVKRRIDSLHRLAVSGGSFRDNRAEDVEKDVAEEYHFRS